MTCLQVRERLPEHAIGLLNRVEARDVDRHLEWCAGCRKEALELQEGATALALALPSDEPPAGLEERIVGRLTSAAGTRPAPSRRGVRVLAAATLAAVLIALGSVGWAIAERRRVQDIRATIAQQIDQIQLLTEFTATLGSNPFEAELFPILEARGSGRVVIFGSRNSDDFILAAVHVAEPVSDRYTIQLTDHSGRVLSGGELARTNNGILMFYEYSGKNLAGGASITVSDGSGRPVLNGTVRPSQDG